MTPCKASAAFSAGFHSASGCLSGFSSFLAIVNYFRTSQGPNPKENKLQSELQSFVCVCVSVMAYSKNCSTVPSVPSSRLDAIIFNIIWHEVLDIWSWSMSVSRSVVGLNLDLNLSPLNMWLLFPFDLSRVTTQTTYHSWITRKQASAAGASPSTRPGSGKQIADHHHYSRQEHSNCWTCQSRSAWPHNLLNMC